MSGRLCSRFGPGRLPYADRRDYGAGIAMAGAALLAVALWIGGVAALRGTGAVESNAFALGAGLLLVAPLAVPTAFAVGTAAWRYGAPETPTPRRGALLGGATAGASLAASAGGAAAFLTFDYARSTGASGPVELLAIPLLFAFGFLLAVTFAAAFAGWLVVPMGALCGWVHERARASQRSRAGPTDA